MAISRPRGVARWMALGLLAGALGGCSTVSSWFSSDTKPKPQELGANPGLLAVHQAWTAKLGAEVPLATDIHRSEEHTSELQSHLNLVCRLLLEKKKKKKTKNKNKNSQIIYH